jgi:tRNA modification GTPase
MIKETIVAIATPPGRGGVGIVRISGPLALSIALQVNGNQSLQPRYAYFSNFYDANQEVVDSGLFLYFKAPHSFTGEDVVEFQGHGSPLVLDNVVNICLGFGARLARPGEFSERAFLNDKIDLAQAEAIADLIHASSQTAARLAIRSLQGDFSKKINALNTKIIQLRLYVEAAIDFPEEEIDFLNDGKIARLLTTIIKELQEVRAQTTQGVIIREGIKIVIAGQPNVGKSTLINRLAGSDVAIVTDIPGTTRDILAAHILLDDIPVHVIDTAGIRESDNVVEQEGIKRAWDAIRSCDCLLIMSDIGDNDPTSTLMENIKASIASNVPIITVLNKIDALPLEPKIEDIRVYVSAKLSYWISTN